MAAKRLTTQSLHLASRAWILAPTQISRPVLQTALLPSQQPPLSSRPFTIFHKLSASPAPSPTAGSDKAVHPKDQVPPSVPESENPDNDSGRHAAFLGEADSNDAHDANREAYGEPAPSLDAKHSAYLGEADSDDGFEAQRDVDGRKEDPVDAGQSAFLGEADSDDGFEGRRAAHPEEGEHNIEDASSSGSHGESGEGDGILEDKK